MSVSVRRVVHDIGKMGVPDCILRKPDKLTPEEREIIEKHPVYAYNFLFPILYLRPALDIPYCHHEKWDGTGYPRKLKGNDIPFAARIFAIADVYDATTSNRPYRKGWTTKKALLKYIQVNKAENISSRRIVDVFLEMLGSKEGESESTMNFFLTECYHCISA